jgi:hypothetical protein
MFSPRTVFVVGAGASFEVGLPLGTDLRKAIKKTLHFADNQGFRDQEVREAVRELSSTAARASDFAHAAHRLIDGIDHVSSIDTFLDIHQENEAIVLLGKLAIAIVILREESKSALATRFQIFPLRSGLSANPSHSYDSSWYVPLGELLTQGVALQDVDEIFRNISFITFNYDRCIETYAEHLLRQAYGLGDRAREIASRLDVLHTYGRVGSPWPAPNLPYVPFGNTNGINFVDVSKNIKTFTEAVDSQVGETIRDRIQNADTLVFLGFGWLPQNLELLGSPSGARRVFFTSKGIMQPDRPTLKSDIGDMLKRPTEYGAAPYDHWTSLYEERGGCVDLFRNHWRLLTRG